MRTPNLRLPIWISVLGGVWLTANPAAAVTPESPEVKAVIEKALTFLGGEEKDGRLGARCLVGLCFLKTNRPVTHPKVQLALKTCNEHNWKGEDNYTVGIAIMFLCEADPDNSKPLIEQMVAELLTRQQAGGGWGYPNTKTGDISQTQYAVLAIWMAQEQGGVSVPLEPQERVLNFLIRVQDPGGGFGYQGVDPGNNERVAQNGIQGSLSAAGMGSTYILADLLHLIDPAPEKEENVPQALKLVKAQKPKRQPKTNKVDVNLLRRAMAEGNVWMGTKDTQHIEWTHYYYYAIERYRSFREHNEGKKEKEPAWYNEIYSKLRNSQDKDGAWEGKDNIQVATCFGVLFLVRSSKKAIDKVVALGDGVLLGGIGLPPNVADMKEKNGRVTDTPLSGGIEELLAILEDEDNPELSRIAESNEVIALSADVSKRGGEIVKLRAMVSAKGFEQRLLAVRSLAKVRDLDNVPILLYALTDPDVRVIRDADKGLRFISRKLDGVGIQFVEGQKPSPAQLDKLRADWRKWYLSIRPDAELLD